VLCIDNNECSSEAEKLSLVERLQKLLTTKGSSESEVMEILGEPALIKQLMVLTDKQVHMYNTHIIPQLIDYDMYD